MSLIPTQEHRISTGARPAGVPEAAPEAAAANVQEMFDAIAGRYDLLNHVLSAGIDRLWWWRAARVFPQNTGAPGGTGSGPLLRHRRYDVGAAAVAAVHSFHRTFARCGFLA